MKKHNNNDKQKQINKNNEAELVTDLKILWNTEWCNVSLTTYSFARW